MIIPTKKSGKTLKDEDSDSHQSKKRKSLNESIAALESRLSCAKINGDKTQVDQLEKIIKCLKSKRQL